MPTQKINGTAFEYACLITIYEKFYLKQKTEINADSSFLNAKKAFMLLNNEEQKKYIAAARVAIDIIEPLEPNMTSPVNENDIMLLGIQPDQIGQAGDVRDVLCIRRSKNWEIGLSCKHNHEAVKHSRLSRNLDFGKSWLNFACSKEYFSDISPVFDLLDSYKMKSKNWSEIKDKNRNIYLPILLAFKTELQKLYDMHKEEVPKNLFQYLLGKNDFYKVIAHDLTKTTEVKPFNMYNTLSLSSNRIKPKYRVSVLKLPTQILQIELKKNSCTTIQIVCDQGWTISLRIHNASTKVEPSLKFDIQLIGVPNSMIQERASWDLSRCELAADIRNIYY